MKKLVPDPPSSLTDALGSTASRAFGCRDAPQRSLLAIREGFNAEEALIQVSQLLLSAEEVSDEISSASGVERGLIWSMIHCVETARAIVDALLDEAKVKAGNVP